MSHLISIQPVGRVKITSTKQGIEIVIPSRMLSKKGIIEKSGAIGVFGFHTVWFIGWSIGGVFAISAFLASLLRGNWFAALFLGFWLCGWAFGEFSVGKTLLSTLFGKEKIVIAGSEITIGDYILGLGKPKQYELANITKVSAITSEEHAAHGRIQLNHRRTTPIRCGKNLDAAEAERLVKYLADIITFRCHTVAQIVFGASPVPVQESQTILQNPDVADLTFPFIRLQQVVIYPETADFYQIERFITYAVNSIGQEYLKKQVEVHLYGDPEQLQPNLRNSLINVCKRMVVAEAGSGHEMMTASPA